MENWCAKIVCFHLLYEGKVLQSSLKNKSLQNSMSRCPSQSVLKTTFASISIFQCSRHGHTLYATLLSHFTTNVARSMIRLNIFYNLQIAEARAVDTFLAWSVELFELGNFECFKYQRVERTAWILNESSELSLFRSNTCTVASTKHTQFVVVDSYLESCGCMRQLIWQYQSPRYFCKKNE